MSMKDEIYKLIKGGPMSDEELEAKIESPRASIRRSRNELVKEGLIEAAGPGKRNQKWQLVGWSPAMAPVYVIQAPVKDDGRPGPSPAEKKRTGQNPADWIF